MERCIDQRGLLEWVATATLTGRRRRNLWLDWYCATDAGIALLAEFVHHNHSDGRSDEYLSICNGGRCPMCAFEHADRGIVLVWVVTRLPYDFSNAHSLSGQSA
jgi:hypothetical protein